MKMTEEAIETLLKEAPVARLATIDVDGAPYVVPVHYAYTKNQIYIHGKLIGRKMENIRRDARVSFEVDEMEGIVLSEKPNPCSTNTAYRSVIIEGEASIPEDAEVKLFALRAIADKYTPQYKDIPIPPMAVAKTAVLVITISNITGKYYKNQ